MQKAWLEALRSANCTGKSRFGPKVERFLARTELKEFVDSSQVLLRGLVARIDRDRAAVAFLRDVVFKVHFEQDSKEIVRFDHAIILADDFSQMLASQVEFPII